ncbi:MAG: metalloregulator ArsR/SmtB family transcription factor [Dehalococcoidia bacterium]|nr:metalloregulator ArsR/SmtB family transcription factor [Dehalococcoidia bacterium]
MVIHRPVEPATPATRDLLVALKALADETRLRIFTLLTRQELCVCEIEDMLNLSQSIVSNHLAVLRQAGLVRARRDETDARWIFYRADPEAVAALRQKWATLLEVKPAPGDRRRAEQVCRIRGR